MSIAARNIHLIKTEAGNNMLPPCKRVLVRFGDHYVPKEARDLVPGDRVRWKKEYVQKTLDEVDAVLSNCSSRYNWARQVVMEQNTALVWIPKLRILLLETEREITRAQMMLEGEDISPAMAARVANRAHAAVEEYGVAHGITPVCWDTVSNWVAGRVVAPAEKGFLDALSGINPKFQPIFQDFRSNGPWAEAYRIYVGLRQVAMSYLAGISGEPSGTSHSAKSTGRDFSPELSTIVDSFGIDMRTGTLDALVVSAESIRMKAKSLSGKKKVDPHLFRGLVTFEDGVAAGLKVDSPDNYPNEEIFGMPHEVVPENAKKAAENAKAFAIAHGFSFADVRRRLLGDGSPIEERKELVRRFFIKQKMSSLDEMRKNLLEGTGLTWEELSPEDKLKVNGEVAKALAGIALEAKEVSESFGRVIQAVEAALDEEA